MMEICRVLGVTRSWYYAHLRRGETQRQREDQVLLTSIKVAFEESEQTYGAGRVVRICGSKGPPWARTVSGA